MYMCIYIEMMVMVLVKMMMVVMMMMSARAPQSKKKYVSRKLSSNKFKTITPCEHRSTGPCNSRKYVGTFYYTLQGPTLAIGSAQVLAMAVAQVLACGQVMSKKS